MTTHISREQLVAELEDSHQRNLMKGPANHFWSVASQWFWITSAILSLDAVKT